MQNKILKILNKHLDPEKHLLQSMEIASEISSQFTVIAEGEVEYKDLTFTHEWQIGGKGLDNLYCTLEENKGKKIQLILREVK